MGNPITLGRTYKVFNAQLSELLVTARESLEYQDAGAVTLRVRKVHISCTGVVGKVLVITGILVTSRLILSTSLVLDIP